MCRCGVSRRADHDSFSRHGLDTTLFTIASHAFCGSEDGGSGEQLGFNNDLQLTSP